jgi:hypothetical protein
MCVCVYKIEFCKIIISLYIIKKLTNKNGNIDCQTFVGNCGQIYQWNSSLLCSFVCTNEKFPSMYTNKIITGKEKENRYHDILFLQTILPIK